MARFERAPKRFSIAAIAVTVVAACAISHTIAAPPAVEVAPLPSADEARARARLLHETMHATLQIVHHEYYREDEGLKIPAATLQRVFREVGKRQKVELRWLAVNAQAMNADHKPRDEFEKLAVEALSGGANEYERIEDGSYRLASTITLTSDCLKCHAPTRTSNKALAAGLIITMPVQPKP